MTIRFSFSSIKSLGFLRRKLDELYPTDFIILILNDYQVYPLPHTLNIHIHYHIPQHFRK